MSDHSYGSCERLMPRGEPRAAGIGRPPRSEPLLLARADGGCDRGVIGTPAVAVGGLVAPLDRIRAFTHRPTTAADIALGVTRARVRAVRELGVRPADAAEQEHPHAQRLKYPCEAQVDPTHTISPPKRDPSVATRARYPGVRARAPYGSRGGDHRRERAHSGFVSFFVVREEPELAPEHARLAIEEYPDLDVRLSVRR